MANLKPIQFRSLAATGDVLEFKSQVSVDQDGVFSLTLPEELATAAYQRAGKKHDFGKISVGTAKVNLRVSGPNLQSCQGFIELVMADHLACEVKTERVIVYGTDIAVAYVKDEAGEFHPNGYWAPRIPGQSGESRWKGSLNATNMAPAYRIGIVARVFDKKSYTRSTGTKVVYEWIHGDYRDQQEGEFLHRLNSFVGLDLHGGRLDLEMSIKHGRLKDMPYTEAAAKFFYDTLLGLCMLADRMENFFGDTSLLTRAIEQQANLLALMAPSSSAA